MAKISVSEAARQGWPSRATIHRKIKAGVISAERDADGRTLVDVAELRRAFGEPMSHATTHGSVASDKMGAQVRTPEQSDAQAEVDALRAENARLAAELEREREHARQERDRLLKLVERALPDQRPPSSPGWWRRVFGGG